MDLNEYAKQFAASGGRARAAAMSPEERSEAARKAVQARWNKYKKKNMRKPRKSNGTA
jgi:general stress protein YciG